MNEILPISILYSSTLAECCPSYNGNVHATDEVECQMANETAISVLWTLTDTITGTNLVDSHRFRSPDTLVS